MGLIQSVLGMAGGVIGAGAGAIDGVLADQWKEFFYCDSLSSDVLVVKGQKRVTSRSVNTKGSDNIITNGSGIVVADGQCMIIVDQGKVAEICAVPGQFTYDSSSEPSIFTGSLGKSIIETFKTIGKRFTYGGDTGKDQRVYYFNTKEIIGNRFGTPQPIPFRVVDNRLGLDIDVTLRCNGVYSYKIVDPILFYANVCGNVTDTYKRSTIDEQLKSEFIDALQPAVGRLSELELRPSGIPAHMTELRDYMNTELSNKWMELRGIQVISIAMNSVSIPKEDEDMIKTAQKNAIMLNPAMAAAQLAGAQADAMKLAASNANGAATGFIGLNMAGSAGGNLSNLYAMGTAQQPQQQPQQQSQPSTESWKCICGAVATGKFCPECGVKRPEAGPAWNCSCGATVTGKFCPECGAKKPGKEEGWTCSCGMVNQGKFCSSCGAKKPADAPLYRCDKCGWEPEDPKNPPKFCPECGDIFDENDIK